MAKPTVALKGHPLLAVNSLASQSEIEFSCDLNTMLFSILLGSSPASSLYDCKSHNLSLIFESSALQFVNYPN